MAFSYCEKGGDWKRLRLGRWCHCSAESDEKQRLFFFGLKGKKFEILREV